MSGDEPPRIFGEDITQAQKREMIVKAYRQLKITFNKLVKPDGEQDSPAKTCRDLFVAHPNKQSGEYWIDPNEGDIKDAILVYCDAATNSTCVHAKPADSGEMSWTGRSRSHIWFGEDIPGGFQLTYKSDGNQISFLQLLSTHAEQNITYHCQNSAVYFDSVQKTFRNSLRLMTWNDVELSARGKRKYRYRSLEDGCKSKPSQWGQTTLRYATDSPQRLPIVDIGIRDIGKPNQKFRLEIGAVCFS